MSKAKRAERQNRILTEREVSDLRAIRAVKSAREVLARVEQIVADHCAAVWSEAYRYGVEDMTGTETLDVVRRNPYRTIAPAGLRAEIQPTVTYEQQESE